jgi:hypothetical protein
LRRIPFTLVDATDLTTPEDITVTNVKATLSLAGATPAASTNDIVKVNGAAGEYYVELTQAESNQTAGSFVRGWLTPPGCALSKFEAQIGPSDTFAAALTESGVATATRNALLNWEPYTGYSLARLLRAMGIVLRGTASGLAGTSVTYTAPAGTATVTATVDTDGNRTAVNDTASGTP